MKKENLLYIISTIFCCCLLIANILASKIFSIFGISLPCAVVIFPIVYIVNDILVEIFGDKIAKRVIILGFIINVLAVLCYNIAILLPGIDPIQSQAFSMILGSTARVLLASFSAYLVGSLLNVFVMSKLKQKFESRLMLRCLASTFVGEFVDAIIFITIAFVGTMPLTNLIIMILSQASFKILYELIAFPITRNTIKLINKKIEN